MSDRLKLEKISVMILVINQHYYRYKPNSFASNWVSRSGIVTTAARILKFKRTDSAKISFTIYTNLGLFPFWDFKLNKSNFDFSLINFFSIFLSFISYITIKYFLVYSKLQLKSLCDL